MMPFAFHIGIPKSGTTSIQEVLGKDDRIHVTRSRFYTASNWWTENTKTINNDKVIIESNETIIMGGFAKVKFDEVLRRMYATNPNAKIIITIRNQPDAIRSMFKYLVRNKKVDEENIGKWMFQSDSGMDFLSICQYATVAKSIANYFPKSQIHFLFFEDLKTNPKKFYQDFYAILGLDITTLSEEKIIKNTIKNTVGFSDEQLVTLHALRKITLFRKNYVANKWYSALARKEKKLHQSIARKFRQKVPQNFLSFKNVNGYEKLISEIKQTNKQLAIEGFVPLETLKKYNYPL